MSTESPVIIEDSNLSLAWARAFGVAMQRGHRNLKPLIVTVGGFESDLPPEVNAIRSALDEKLVALNKNSCEVSALTIFPYKAWVRRHKPSCAAFSDLCVNKLLPRLRKRDSRNQYGTYFERMMAYTGKNRGGDRTVNQLEFIINLLNGNKRPRESALPIACFDPAKDHTGQPVRGFPCLQQVSVSYDNDRRLAINATYPTQYIFDRAYGNYLGLSQLGNFLAHETNHRFSRLTCFIGKPELGDVSKSNLNPLVEAIARATARNLQEAFV